MAECEREIGRVDPGDRGEYGSSQGTGVFAIHVDVAIDPGGARGEGNTLFVPGWKYCGGGAKARGRSIPGGGGHADIPDQPEGGWGGADADSGGLCIPG